MQSHYSAVRSTGYDITERHTCGKIVTQRLELGLGLGLGLSLG